MAGVGGRVRGKERGEKRVGEGNEDKLLLNLKGGGDEISRAGERGKEKEKEQKNRGS